MHPFGARVISRSDELLRILARERLLVIRFFEGARHRGVPIFDIEPTRKTHIPIVVVFINVGEVGVPDLRDTCVNGRDDAATIWDKLARDARPSAALRT